MCDNFAVTLASQIVRTVEESDDTDSYIYATGMRRALELYMGPDAARDLLFSMGHEY